MNPKKTNGDEKLKIILQRLFKDYKILYKEKIAIQNLKIKLRKKVD